MSNEFKPFMTRQAEDGQWECYHHAVHGLTATGDTEAEAQSKVLTMCETVMGVNHTNLERWYDRAKAAEATLEKARAVLAEYSEAVKYSTHDLSSAEFKPMIYIDVLKALSALADALGGEHE